METFRMSIEVQMRLSTQLYIIYDFERQRLTSSALLDLGVWRPMTFVELLLLVLFTLYFAAPVTTLLLSVC